jgi:hypothetical protein
MPTDCLRRWGAAILAAAVATSLLGGGSAHALTGAEPVPVGTYGFSAKVYFGDVHSGDASSCSGALVDRNWVLTAKSCFAEGTAPVTAGAPGRPTTVVVGRTDLAGDAGRLLTATSIVPHPDRNLVLVRLSQAVDGVTPVSLATAAPTTGETLTITGYGRTSTEWVPDRLHQASFTTQTVGATSIDLIGASPGATICKGDAGGPVFRDNAGGAELVALNSTSWQKGCLGETETRDGATATRLDDLGAWIGEQTADVQIFGVLGDGRLTYSAIDSASGDLQATRESTASLGFTPKAMATLNENTILITSMAGTIHRIDITSLAPLAFTVTPLMGGWASHDLLTYDGYGSLYGIIGGLLRRYTLTAHKPQTANFTRYTDISTGFVLNAVTSPGPGRILGNVIHGQLRSYKINGSGAAAWSGNDLATTGWADRTHLLSPGGGFYYARTATGRLDRYHDLNPYDGSGSDLQSFATDPVSPTGWNQVLLSARPWTGLLSVFGTRPDGRLSYTAIDPVSGTKHISTVSRQTLGFTPKAMATLNSDTLLVTHTGASLYRVDITSLQPLTFTRTEQRLGGGWVSERMVYDGHGSLFGQYDGTMLRYTVTKPKPADPSTDITNRTVVGASGWVLETLTATGKGRLLATQSTGALPAYTIDAAGIWARDDLAASGWNGFASLVSPGSGLYYRRDTNGVLTGYLDASPFDGSGTDLTAYVPAGTTSGGWDPILSALPYDSWPDNTRR